MVEANIEVHKAFMNIFWGNSIFVFYLGLYLGYNILLIIAGIAEKGLQGYHKSLMVAVTGKTDIMETEHKWLFTTILMSVIYIIGYCANVLLVLLLRG
jgi:hypothetical protein